MFNIIVATDENNGIGKNNSIPWNIPEDVELFKTLWQRKSFWESALKSVK